jgi:large subunit ribosomal protein L25
LAVPGRKSNFVANTEVAGKEGAVIDTKADLYFDEGKEARKMAQQIELHAEPRTTLGKHLGALRRSGCVPGNVYGPAMESIPVQVAAKEFETVAARVTPTTMLHLFIGSEREPRMVYLQNIQWEPVRRQPLHLDFYAVNVKRHMRSAVLLAFHGEAPAAKSADATLLQPVSRVHVAALAESMPESIPVDLSVLTEVDQSIYARDLSLPEGVTLLDDPDELIARVQQARAAVAEAVEEAAKPAEEQLATTEEPSAKEQA